MKALVVLSGGMDSATVLGVVVAKYGKENVHAITFDYGSKHNKMENEAACSLVKHYGIKSGKIVALPFVGELFKSDLLKSGGEIPEGHYADPSMKKTVVPFRNGIMLSIAAGYAESIGCKKVYIGNHAGDHAIYPDCRVDFIAPMEAAMSAGTYAKIELVSPFVRYTKGDIVKIGVSLGVPYGKTYSCYKGKARPCGKCGTCVEREEAFIQAGAVDPLDCAE